MADEQDNGREGPAKRPALTLTITYDPTTRTVNVTGPSDLVIALGMCEMAKQVMQGASAPRQRVVPVGMVPPFLAHRGGRG